MSDYVIEKGIPIPPPRGGDHQRKHRKRNHPVYDMEIGDSVLIPVDARGQLACSVSFYQAAARAGYTVAVRLSEDGKSARIWRTA